MKDVRDLTILGKMSYCAGRHFAGSMSFTHEIVEEFPTTCPSMKGRGVAMQKKILVAFCLMVLAMNTSAHAREVLINPITPDIRDRLKQSTALVRGVEDTMAPKVANLEKLYQTYKETCQGNENDRGCIEIQNQIRETYKEFLVALGTDVPLIKQSVLSTADTLGQSIKARTHTKNLKEIYYGEVAKKGKLPVSRGPLSKKLSEILVAMGHPNMDISILEMSLRTQADLISAAEILEYLDAEISRQIVMVDIMEDFSALNPEMATVMRDVAELFGYDVDFGYEEQLDAIDPAIDDWRN